MRAYSEPETLVLSAVRSSHALSLDQALVALPQLRWNEVFHAVDRLSREGTIVLRRRGFEYELLAAPSEPC